MHFDSNNLTAGHLAAQNGEGQYDPMRQANFVVEIYGIPGEDIISLSIEKAFLPQLTLAEVELKHLNETRYVAGSPTWDNGSCTCKDYVIPSVASLLSQWSDLHYDRNTGHVHLAYMYKKTGKILQFGPDGSWVRRWELEGLWMPVFNPGDSLDYNGGLDVVKIELTLRFDKARGPFQGR
jgi:hypothetical protein